MHETEKLDVLNERFKSFINTKIQLIKLEAVERSTVLASGLFAWMLILLSAIIALFFLSIGASIYIGKFLGRYDLGFMCIAGFYVLLAGILFLGRTKLTETPLRNAILNKLRNVK